MVIKNNTNTTALTPKSFWVFSVLILIWGTLGAFHFIDFLFMTVDRLIKQGMTIEQAEHFLGVPKYVTVIFGLGVWSGFIGAVLLALRKAWSYQIFLFSAVITLVSFINDYISGSFTILGPVYQGVMIVTLLVAFLEVWYSKRMKTLGILQ